MGVLQAREPLDQGILLHWLVFATTTSTSAGPDFFMLCFTGDYYRYLTELGGDEAEAGSFFRREGREE